MKKHWSTILLILALLVGLSLLLYPIISDYWNSIHQSKAIASYVEAISNLDEEEYNKMLTDARSYNRALRRDAFSLTEEQKQKYYELLDPGGLGIMAYIEIDSIGVTLPIYHGTSETVLQKYLGHLEWSSLPVGGRGTHCVISGHRGLPSSTLFTNLDKMSVGDTFVIRTLNEVLTYEVEAVHIVEPEDFQYLKIEEGQDLCTLLTCTPYGINSHRLLVRAHRIDNAEETSVRHVTADAMQIEPLVMAPFIAVPILTVVIILIFTFNKKKK